MALVTKRFTPGFRTINGSDLDALVGQINSLFGEILTAGQVGAVFDGDADVAAPINAAMQYLAASDYGGTLVLPYSPASFGLLKSGPIVIPKGRPASIRGQGAGSVLKGGAGWSGPYLKIGFGGTGTVYPAIFSDMWMQRPSSGTFSGIQMQAFNNGRIRDVRISDCVDGIDMADSFAVELSGNIIERASAYGIHSTTACHNLKVRDGGIFACAGAGIKLDSETFNIVFDGVDMESSAYAYDVTNVDSLMVANCYIEACTTALFKHAGCRNVDIKNCLLGLSPSTALSGITGGQIDNCTLITQDLTLDAPNLDGFDVGYLYKFGVGSYALGQAWKTPTLLNSWTQQASNTVVGYRRDRFNTVYIKGGVTGGVAGSVVFTLPAGYLPPDFANNFACFGAGGSSWIQVKNTGDVVAVAAPSNLAGMNGIAFSAY